MPSSNLLKAPSYIPDAELEELPVKSDWRATEPSDNSPFNWDRHDRTFDEPFYFERLGSMAMIFTFDTPSWLTFFGSPSGDGQSIVAG